MKGWRTILLNAAIAGGTAALGYLLDFDWAAQVGPVLAVVIINVLNIALRLITTTPPGQAGLER